MINTEIVHFSHEFPGSLNGSVGVSGADGGQLVIDEPLEAGMNICLNILKRRVHIDFSELETAFESFVFSNLRVFDDLSS